ncbi:hypothetical protein NC652_023392 [Populus alba x Populus x berolinensis]|nr:hypothetical protein NC652_023392 [Populus alba x Populus x berolinensis]
MIPVMMYSRQSSAAAAGLSQQRLSTVATVGGLRSSFCQCPPGLKSCRRRMFAAPFA